MSIQTEITRIKAARDLICNKLVELGLASSTDKLDSLSTTIDNIENQGAVSESIKEGEVYTVPKGYHNGSGTITGIAGGGNYLLQGKTVTPSKSRQNIAADSGYYGLSAVIVKAIPDQYQDVSDTTAEEADVLESKVFVKSDGTSGTGTMINNGELDLIIDGLTETSVVIPAGYTTGGTVSLTDDILNALIAI